jgi:AmmeMemoRadiSam system protein B
LAHVAPQSRVIGISVGDASLPELLRFGVAMSIVLRDMPELPLLLVSSDMNHFANEEQTRRVDRLALESIATLDAQQVYETVRRNRISMCGMAPCVVAMEALRWLGCLKRCETVGYTTSAETSRDTNRVVGYAGLLFGKQ